MTMTGELAIIARFHAKPGRDADVAAALTAQVAVTRAEPGCIAIHAFASTRDAGLFFIHSRWTNEATFDTHAGLATTESFVARMEALIDHPFDAQRVRVVA